MLGTFSRLFLGVVIGLGLTCPTGSFAQTRAKPNVAQTMGGVVACDSPIASDVGRDVLLAGGNAVDAAVATGFAMAVTWPEAGNIGGGGFMMIAPAEGDVVCVDYREKSPAATDNFTFVDQKNRHDSRMVGVPGTVRGLELAHKKFGKLNWKELVAPSVRLARDGFVVDESLAGSINGVIRSAKSAESKLHDELIRVYGHTDGRDWKAGDTLKLPDLAKVLERIAKNPDDFYSGETAEILAKFMAASNGLMTSEDLKDYQAIVRPAIKSKFKGYDVFGAPPPSSGGLTIGLALNVFEKLDVKSDLPDGLDWSAEHLHNLAEIMKRAFRERAAHLGDADFVKIPDHFLSDEFAQKLANSINQSVATPSQDLAGDIELNAGAYESAQTTHFSVVDAEGMAVSNTYTLEASWGSRVIAPGTGFVLNNEMGDFNWYPDYTNLDGRIGTKANLVEPGKRMLSSMSPTLVKKDGKVVLVVGSPGGRTIINTTLGVILQKLYFNRSLEESVSATRFHHQWLPDILRLESARTTGADAEAFKTLIKQLRNSKQSVAEVGRQGSVHAISVDPETNVRTGVSDFRRGGNAAVTSQLKSSDSNNSKKQGSTKPNPRSQSPRPLDIIKDELQQEYVAYSKPQLEAIKDIAQKWDLEYQTLIDDAADERQIQNLHGQRQSECLKLLNDKQQQRWRHFNFMHSYGPADLMRLVEAFDTKDPVLSDEQKNAITKVRKRWIKLMGDEFNSAQKPKSFAEVSDLIHPIATKFVPEIDALITNHLTAAQRNRLDQFDLQMRIVRESIAIFQSSEAVKGLNLTADQKSHLKSTMTKLDGEKPFSYQWSTIRMAAYEHMIKSFSKEQKKIWSDKIGAPRDVMNSSLKSFIRKGLDD